MGSNFASVEPVPTIHNILSSNFSRPTFDYKTFWQILTSEKFPENKAKNWIENHFLLTFQVNFYF